MERLRGLDALRGIAALCIVYYHLTINPDGLTSKGYLAVDFFLMLSGYVMARTYERKFFEGLSPARFFLARYKRLWPVMALGTLIGIAVASGRPIAGVICGLLLIPMAGFGPSFPFNNPAWSTSVELQLNAIHAFVLKGTSNRTLVALITVSAIAAIPMSPPGHDLDGGAWHGQIGFAFIRGMISYPLGVLLWRIWQDVPPLKIPAPVVYSAMPLLMLASTAAPVNLMLDYLFILIICPLLIAGGLQLKPRWGEFAGASSFPLYAFHNPLLIWAEKLNLPTFAGALSAIALAISYANWPALKRHLASKPCLRRRFLVQPDWH